MELSDAWPLCLCTQLQSGLSELPLVPTIAGLAFPRVHVVHAHSHTPQALVLLQLHANLDVLLVASWQELSQHVCAFTRALSQLPSKYVPLGGGVWRQARVGGPHRWGSQSFCLGVLIPGSSGTPRPFLSAQQGTGPQVSK